MCFIRKKQFSRKLPIHILPLPKQRSATCWLLSSLQEMMFLKKFLLFPVANEVVFLWQN